jgi:hypothetical protein
LLLVSKQKRRLLNTNSNSFFQHDVFFNMTLLGGGPWCQTKTRAILRKTVASAGQTLTLALNSSQHGEEFRRILARAEDAFESRAYMHWYSRYCLSPHPDQSHVLKYVCTTDSSSASFVILSRHFALTYFIFPVSGWRESRYGCEEDHFLEAFENLHNLASCYDELSSDSC